MNAADAVAGSPGAITISTYPYRASAEDLASARISAGCRPGEYVALEVADTGPGIPEEEIRRLTDPFYSTSDTPENLGLGLSICQTILRHHGGTLSISSALGQWTRVTLALPLEADRVRT